MSEAIDFSRYPLPKIAKCKPDLDFSEHKRILVAGSGSYIGQLFIGYMSQFSNYEVDDIKTTDSEWKKADFSKYDAVYDVAGIAHIKETSENKHLYYEVNRDLAVELAKKAKEEGVKQFIYLSSMSVYGLTVGSIHRDTPVNPINAYGKSKLEAEQLLWQLNDENFTVAIVRPPMVYGKGCKGNYQTLRKFALKVGFFPKIKNERSMLFIDNLSSAIRGIIHNEVSGLYFPQNIDYVCTHEMVRSISLLNGRKLSESALLNPCISFATKKITVFQKVFGSLTYESSLNVPEQWIECKDFQMTLTVTEDK